MFCTKCGSKIEEGKKFCTKCGALLGADKGDTVKPDIMQPETKTKKSSKKGLYIGIAAGVSVAVAGILAVLFFVVLPAVNYDKAVELAGQGKHAEAVEIFTSLGEYKDSKKRLETSQNLLDYKEAAAFFEDGDYERAQRAYEALGGYKDSKSMVQECQTRLDYAGAVALYEAGEYRDAQAIFDQTLEYEDSEDLSYACGYMLTYQEAVDKAEKGVYSDALELLTSIEKSIADRNAGFSTDMISDTYASFREDCYQHVCYNNGRDYFEQGLFYSAYVELSKAGDIKEARELAKACAQPFETGEMYRNSAYTDNEVRVTFNVPEENARNVYIKIYAGNDLAATCQIKAGESLSIRLPSGIYSFKKAEGTTWYGAEEYFGDQGSYSEIVFGEEQRVSAQLDTLTLLVPIFSYTMTFSQTDGNLGEDSISLKNF